MALYITVTLTDFLVLDTRPCHNHMKEQSPATLGTSEGDDT